MYIGKYSRQCKAFLSKIKFVIGRTPSIEKCFDTNLYVPKPYKAVVTITADFEMAWAWRYSKSIPLPYIRAIDKARLERENLPQILAICDYYGIPITWATVGHLFLDKCNRESGLAHRELPRLGKFENNYWKFSGDDWYEYDPCSNYLDAPEWYCPDLIEMILNSKIKHEIGCHTFSHIDCRDGVCSSEVFNAEICECIKLAKIKGLELRSFVHPGHTIGNLSNLSKQGFTSFQSDPGNILGYPVLHEGGVWELKRTYELAYNPNWTIDYHLYRYKTIIERAIENRAVCNLWFHPSLDVVFITHIMPQLFDYLREKKNIIRISRVDEYIDTLNSLAK